MAFITVPEFCAKYRRDRGAIYPILQNGDIPAMKVGRRWMIDEDTFLEEFKKAPVTTPEIACDMPFIRTAEAAYFLGVSVDRLDDYKREGRLKYATDAKSGWHLHSINHIVDCMKSRKRKEKDRGVHPKSVRAKILRHVQRMIDDAMEREGLQDDIDKYLAVFDVIPELDEIKMAIDAVAQLPEPARSDEFAQLWLRIQSELQVKSRLRSRSSSSSQLSRIAASGL